MPLTDKMIEHALPGVTPAGRVTTTSYKIGDSGGLFLLVTPTGGKCWRMKYRFEGREKSLGFGRYPRVGLLEARRSRDDAKQLLARGIDPSVVLREKRAEERSEKLMQKNSSIVQVAIALDGTVKIWKGRAAIRLRPDEARSVADLLMKLTG